MSAAWLRQYRNQGVPPQQRRAPVQAQAMAQAIAQPAPVQPPPAELPPATKELDEGANKMMEHEALIDQVASEIKAKKPKAKKPPKEPIKVPKVPESMPVKIQGSSIKVPCPYCGREYAGIKVHLQKCPLKEQHRMVMPAPEMFRYAQQPALQAVVPPKPKKATKAPKPAPVPEPESSSDSDCDSDSQFRF